MAAMDWRRAVRRRNWTRRIVVTRREAAKVIGLDSVAMRFQEIVAAVVCHADARLMAASVANHVGLGSGVDRRDGHGFGKVLLHAGDAFHATHCGDAPVWGMPNTIQIDHFDISTFLLDR